MAVVNQSTRLLVLLSVALACRNPAPESVAVQAPCGCPADAAVDAPADAPMDAAPDAVPPDAWVDVYANAWGIHTIMQGASSGSYRGADGVDTATIGGHLAIAVPWEQGGAVTVSLDSGPWQNITIVLGMFGAEDAKFLDADGDGRLDVAIARDGDARIHISFQPAVITDPWTTILLPTSQTPYHGRWLQLAAADVDGDGLVDIVGGSRVGTATEPAGVSWFKNPGSSSARTGSAWTYHSISIGGWIMSVIPRDVDGDGDLDVVVSDRTWYLNTSSVRQYGLMGTRWLENVSNGASWINHTIATPAPNSAAYGMIAVVDWDGDGLDDVVEGQGADGAPNIVTIHRNLGGWLTWGSESVTVATNVGSYQAIGVGDIDRDGRKDLVIATTEGSGVCCNNPLEGVYWMRNVSPGVWSHKLVIGSPGTKFDNVVLRDMDGDGDLDVLETEQTDNRGLEWYENPGH